MRVVLIIVGLMFNTRLSLRRGFQTNSLKIPPRISMIDVLILNLKRGEMLVQQEKAQLVVCVVRNMGENFLFRLIIVMVVEKVSIW